MKNKILAVTSCTAFLCGNALINNCFAVESAKGNSVYKNNFFIGASIGSLSSSSELKEPDNMKIVNNIDISENGLSVGVNAGYKIYFANNAANSFFLTPEIFYNNTSTKGNDNKGYGYYDIEISPTYGAKVSLGYSLRNKHAFSFGVGFQNIDYKYRYSYLTINSSQDDNELAGLFSINYEYNINKSLAMNVNLDYSKFTFETPNKNVTTSAGKVVDEIETSVTRLSVGASYKF